MGASASRHATTPGALAPDVQAACTSPFVQSATGCHAVVDTSVSWPEARDACVALGGTLVVIEGQAENDHILSVLPGGERVWLGLSDLASERMFVWVTGAPPTFTAWAGGEPNSDVADCVEMSATGPWNEEDCLTVNPYVCER